MRPIETRLKRIEDRVNTKPSTRTHAGYDPLDLARLLLDGTWTGPGDRPDLDDLPLRVDKAQDLLERLGFATRVC